MRSPKALRQTGNKFLRKVLSSCRDYNVGELTKDRLIDATMKLGFVNVIDAFHIVNREDVPDRFFIDERKRNKGIRATEELYKLFLEEDDQSLNHETEARWRLVETAWELNVSRHLIQVEHDKESQRLITGSANGRVDITGSRDALNGYQRGKCLYCFDLISIESGSIQVTGEGVVSSIHPLVRDDGERVQKFIVLLPTGLKLLVIHDFEASSLISNLKTGDSVEFSGVYTWNSSGGIVSGTHQDPAGLRWPGWIKHRGKTYQ